MCDSILMTEHCFVCLAALYVYMRDSVYSQTHARLSSHCAHSANDVSLTLPGESAAWRTTTLPKSSSCRHGGSVKLATLSRDTLSSHLVAIRAMCCLQYSTSHVAAASPYVIMNDTSNSSGLKPNAIQGAFHRDNDTSIVEPALSEIQPGLPGLSSYNLHSVRLRSMSAVAPCPGTSVVLALAAPLLVLVE